VEGGLAEAFSTLLPVQRRASGAVDPAAVHGAAAAGLAGAGGTIPHFEAIQSSFGDHDISGVQAHVGGPAADACADMDASAYASGDRVAFARAPDLHTAAHEAAHVVQQRAGVDLRGGVGEEGDAYERQADAAADAVVRGEPAVLPRGGAEGRSEVQRRAADDRDEPAELPAGFEEILTGTLDMNVPDGDPQLAQTRVKLLRAQMRALHRANRTRLRQRLEEPRKGDALAALFEAKLSTAERRRLLAILNDDAPAATEQPDGPASGTPAASVPGTEEAVLQSENPAVHGRTVSDVGAELHAKAASYARFPTQQQEYATYNLRNEKRILDDHDGIVGSAINLFNDADAPNPERWHKAVVDWGVVQTQLQAVLALQPTASSINQMGALAERGLAGWDAAMAQTSQYSDEFLRYLEGFSQAAKAVHAGVELTAEILMAGAIACAVVLTGPAILAVGGQFAASVGATGAAAVAIKGTTALVGAGVVGAGFKGTAQASGQVLVETVEAVHDLAAKGKSLDQAAAGFDWSAVGDKGWHGVKTGFIDGIMAQGGFAIEAVATKLIGKVATKFLGPYAGRLYAQVLRKSAERAASAGLAGGVTGALDAGTRAAVDGRSLPEIFDAMQMGGALGFGLGTIFGGIFGAVSETRAARAGTAADPVPTHAPVPGPPAAPAGRAPHLDPERFQGAPASGLDGTMAKERIVDTATGKKYLFKPNAPDMPLHERALERGLTPDTIADRAKASQLAAEHFEIDSPAVQVVEYKGQIGSLQEWRSSPNTSSLRQLESTSPDRYAAVTSSPEYARLRSDLDTFDYVLNNLDRNDGNLLVTLDDTGRVVDLVAIDNDLTFTKSIDRFLDGGTWARGLPERYSRSMVDKVRAIASNPEGFRRLLRPHLSSDEIDAAVIRARRIVDDVDAKIAARGEAATFWDDASSPSPPVERSPDSQSAASQSTNSATDTLPADDDRIRGVNRTSHDLESQHISDDGVEVRSDIRTMSPAARHVVRQLQQRGSMRVDQIHPSVVAEASRWFGKEIAVVQSPAARLRVTLGEERGFLKTAILESEVFILHSHPVMTSTVDDFGVDLAKAGKHVEAVVDWSGQLTYYSKSGIKNPVSPHGYIEPLVGYQAAFMDANGMIVGFARIDVEQTASGLIVRVVE
jgi:hypothetical protein